MRLGATRLGSASRQCATCWKGVAIGGLKRNDAAPANFATRCSGLQTVVDAGNQIGRAAGEALGLALQTNNTLKVLNIAGEHPHLLRAICFSVPSCLCMHLSCKE